jgi:hypothetical protein
LGRLRGEIGADAQKADAELSEIQAVAKMEKSDMMPTSYLSMLTGRGSGKLHIGRRVQLVIWLQIIQEWVGIAGVTICEFATRVFSARKRLCPDAPTIFRLAGFNSDKAQWISGLNNIFYMVYLRARLTTRLADRTVRHAYLRVYPRQNRPTMDFVLGIRIARDLDVLVRWLHPAGS